MAREDSRHSICVLRARVLKLGFKYAYWWRVYWYSG